MDWQQLPEMLEFTAPGAKIWKPEEVDKNKNNYNNQGNKQNKAIRNTRMICLILCPIITNFFSFVGGLHHQRRPVNFKWKIWGFCCCCFVFFLLFAITMPNCFCAFNFERMGVVTFHTLYAWKHVLKRSLKFIRLLRVVFSSRGVITTRSNRMKFRLAEKMSKIDMRNKEKKVNKR